MSLPSMSSRIANNRNLKGSSGARVTRPVQMFLLFCDKSKRIQKLACLGEASKFFVLSNYQSSFVSRDSINTESWRGGGGGGHHRNPWQLHVGVEVQNELVPLPLTEHAVYARGGKVEGSSGSLQQHL